MVSIERNTLNYLEKYLNVLDEMLTNTKAINEEVFTNVENINWSKEDTLNMYIKILIRLIDEGSIVKVRYQLTKLSFISKDCNIEMALFYSLLERFKSYLEKVIDIYLLDQIYYILINKFPINADSISTPYSTKSLEDKLYFGIDYYQLNMSEYSGEIDFQKNIFLIKEDYQGKLNLLLNSFDYRLRKSELNMCLKELIDSYDNNNPFVALMYLKLNTLVFTPPYNKKKLSKDSEDPLQLTLFKK